MDYKGVKLTERGWAGHYICADRCIFHRNTLLEKNGVKIVVSSVGKMRDRRNMEQLTTIGCDRYYETMVFFAKEDKWQDADASRGEIYCTSPHCDDPYDEMPANILHDETVEKFVEKLNSGEPIKSIYEIYNEEEV